MSSDSNYILSEIARNTRRLFETNCCSYNNIGNRTLTVGTSWVIPINTLHSFSWEVDTGGSVTIATGATSATYYNCGSIEFSNLNAQQITITAAVGSVRILYVY